MFYEIEMYYYSLRQDVFINFSGKRTRSMLLFSKIHQHIIILLFCLSNIQTVKETCLCVDNLISKKKKKSDNSMPLEEMTLISLNIVCPCNHHPLTLKILRIFSSS